MAQSQSQHQVRAHRIALFLICACLLSSVVLAAATTPEAETITLSEGSSVSIYGEVLHGLIFDMPATAVAGTPASVRINNCVVKEGNVEFHFDSSANGPFAVNATLMNLFIVDVSLVLQGNSPSGTSIAVRYSRGTMAGATPFIDMSNYEPGDANLLYVTDIRVVWLGGGPGGYAIFATGSNSFFLNGAFQVQRVHAKNAAGLFTCGIGRHSNGYYCIEAQSGIVSFDFNYCENCSSAMINVTKSSTFGANNDGMLRFANNTITGGQPFFSSIASNFMYTTGSGGNIIFSDIYSDGALFDVPSGGTMNIRTTSSMTLRHINVKRIGITQVTQSASNTVAVFLGNLTENGVRLEETNGEGYTGWNINYGNTVLIDDMGFIVYNPNNLANMGNDDTPSASWAYCQRSSTQGTVSESLYPSTDSVKRAVCRCQDTGYPPYCTVLPDLYQWYDGYEPR